MPYINKTRRQELDVHPDDAETMGELTYLLCKEVDRYVLNKGKNFQAMGEAVGALEAAKLEFSRRVLAKHEDAKLLEHGEVWEVG